MSIMELAHDESEAYGGQAPADRITSFAQQRLWFLEQLGTMGGAYVLTRWLRLRGDLDREVLARALERAVARHEALRTTFHTVAGEPVQRIHPAEESSFPIIFRDLSGDPAREETLQRLMARDAERPFDLARGPLVRGLLVRLSEDEHVLLVCVHHIAFDGWSIGVLMNEVSVMYAAFLRGEEDPLPPLPMQYADYAEWQRAWLSGEVLERQGDYWRTALAGVPELLELPADRARPAKQDHAGAHAALELDEELTARLKALARRNGVTLFAVLMAGWGATLGRLAGQTDVVVGTPAANRRRRELRGLMGFFVNTLALRVDLAGQPTVAQLLRRVKERTVEAQQHQDLPFEQVVELLRPARSTSHTPIFQVSFTWHNSPRGTLRLGDVVLESTGSPTPGTAKFDLSLTLQEEHGRIGGGVEYATALFDAATIERYLAYFRRVLGAMADDESQVVDCLPLMDEAERQMLVEEWNDTAAEYPAESCIHELFEAQVRRTPGATALVHERETLSYGELNARANRLARHLVRLGVKPGDRVALCVERSPEMVAGVLAVLKAGAAFVPLDPAYPPERLRFMLEDSAPVALLTRPELAGLFAGVPVVDVDAGAGEAETDLPRRAAGPEAVAYLTYTSGSTGRPKGVSAVHHRALNLIHWYGRELGIGADDAVLIVSSYSFDGTYRNLFAPLFAGGRVHLAAEPFDPHAILEQIQAGGITMMNLTPTAFGALVEASRGAELGGMRRIVLVGEPAQARTLLQLPEPRPELVNLYGPTECSGITTFYRLDEDLARYLDRPVPAGRPIANGRVYVLDAHGQPVPTGVAGEIHIGGVPVGPGYHARPELTAERYVADPFSAEPGARMYRTGDVGRWLADGTLEVLGRNDSQVKIRGFRIEPGEVEACLLELPEVREAAVVAREDAPGEKRLVAYYVAGAVEVETIRSHVAERLPDYMVPAAYVRLDALPVSPNGKLDRRALPAPEQDAFAARAYVPPAGEAEEAVAAIWCEVLGVERVGREDHFFELGGHSLLAVQVVSRVRWALGAEVALGHIFTHPVLADFARALERELPPAVPPVAPAAPEERGALSFAQRGLWFLERMGSTGAAYHIPVHLRLHGALDRVALRRALRRVVARHEALRTTFAEVDGEPVQVIHTVEESGFALHEHDLRGRPEEELRRLMAEEAAAPFDLARGPLVRARLVQTADDEHALLVTMHHIVSDGWSMGVLVNEMSALYSAFHRGEADPLPPLPVQYADYAAWQRRRADGGEQAEYWTRTLAGAPELLEIPADHPRPAAQDYAGAFAGVELDEELTAALKALGQRHGATLYMTLLAGWAIVLGRLSGQHDLVIGSPTANRGRGETEGLIGYFVNTLALRLDLSGTPTVAELLGRVRARAMEAQQHQDLPFDRVVELLHPTRSLAHSPVFQVNFTWQNTPRARVELPGLTVGASGLLARGTAKIDLSLALEEVDGRIVGGVEYATSMWERATIDRYLGYLRRVLRAMAADETESVGRLPLLGADERRQVLEEWNGTAAELPAQPCIHELFEAWAARTPHAVAVVQGGESLTYAELNARANRLAHHLRARGVGRDDRVAICVERGPEMIVAPLAVLKAGGAYVPLDPAYPLARLHHMLEDSAPALLLAEGALAGLFAGMDVPVLELDGAWAAGPETNPEHAGAPEQLAYVIYTSGSTGRPKGVAVEHRGLCNMAAAQARTFGVAPESRVLQFASFSFDACAFELVMALCSGAALYLPPRGATPVGEPLVRMMSAARITHATLPPAVLAALPGDAELPSVQTLVLAGDVVTGALARRWAPGRRLFNAYGPTETTVWATVHECGAEDNPPIGRPIANARAYVLDAAGEPVPVGVAGELHVGGAGVARGYLKRPELTAERFVEDRFGGGRMYRTGDLARWLPNGTLEFLGRNDHQVKVRGYRIELGEIESRLAEYPGVREAAVLAREDAPGEKRLVAYLVAPEPLDVEALRAHLAERVPEYMVPAAFVRLDAMPLTPNGKTDRRALPAPDEGAHAAHAYEAPAPGVETAVAEIWADLLGVERVGRLDHFFDMGGHSLLAVQVVSRVWQELDVEAEPGDLFLRPVLADFAAGLETAAPVEDTGIGRAADSERQALSFAQQRLWFLEQLGGAGAAYHVPLGVRLRGALDGGALRRALDRVVARHEALRTTFAQVHGEPVQRIAPEGRFDLVEHDLTGSPDGELERLVAEEAGAPFDLAHGPLVRGRLVKLDDDDHVLLVTMHHIVSDGWSMGVLVGELNALYTAFLRGDKDPLPPLPIQYADFAAWQRHRLDGDVLREQAAFWKAALAGAPELLELPADRPRPAVQDHAGAFAGVELDEELTAALKALGQRHGTTLFMTLMAAWAVVLARLSGQEDVVIGTPTANRGRPEIEGLIGFFVNTLALRLDLSGEPTVAALLGRVKERALEAQAHQDIPFEQVVEVVQPARTMAHSPLFQVLFAWQNAPMGSLELPGLTLEPIESASRTAAKFDLSLTLHEAAGRIVGGVEYATALFDAPTIDRYLGYLRRVLAAMVADERQTVGRLPMLGEDERRRLVEEWNATDAELPADMAVHALFEAQARRTPDAIAVVDGGESLTYAELDARANGLARHLRVGRAGEMVAILIPRSLELVVAELAVLKAGAVYVPIDPTFPAARIRFMVSDSGAAIVLARSGDVLPELAAERIDVDTVAGSADALPEAAGGEAAAYVMYTSGSTGEPKGVVVPHRAIVRLVINNGYADFGADDRVAFAANPAFDASTMEVWAPLLNGGRIVIIPQDVLLEPARFAAALREQGVDVLWMTVGLFNRYVDALQDVLPRLRYLIVGGDALDPRVIARVVEQHKPRHLLNGYGPTESTTFAITHDIQSVAEGSRGIPLGRPISNTRIYLLDNHLQPVPTGAAGEVYIGGAGVALGYLNQPALTEERFVEDVFGGGRMYRTGDVARWLPDGTVEFLGRNDNQVKVRGYRIELGEIEARLCEHPALREVAVVAREDEPGDKRLVAYCVGMDEVDAEALRTHLTAKLPEYMVPAAYVWLETLPLTSNGKVDRRALPAPDADAFATREYEAPAGETEEVLAGIWSEVLGVERVGRRDHFFALGGHSLLAVQLISRVRQALGVEVALGELFTRPTLADFAAGLATAAPVELPAIVPMPRGERLALSFAQQRLWFLEELGAAGRAYHVPIRLRLHGVLDRQALGHALDRIVQRHEALRTTFHTADGEPYQAVAHDSRFPLVDHDLSGHPHELRRLMAEEAGAPFDLARGPLVRGRLVRLGDEEHVLLITMHHIVSDGWSMGVLTREASALYAAFRAGEADPLPPLEVQYADYAAWQRGWVNGEALRRQADYWNAALAGAPALLELPTDRPRPARQDPAGGYLALELDEELTASLKALSQRHGTTLFMTLMAAWATVLARLSGQDDIVIGTPTANRGRAEIEGLIGFFVNTLALRVDLSGEPTVAELLERVRARALEAQAHQDIPFEAVVEGVQPGRSMAHTPLFQVMLTWQSASPGTLDLPGLTVDAMDSTSEATAKFDLSLALREVGSRIAGGLTYATALFDAGTVERYLGYFRRVLAAMAADESQPVGRLPLMDEAERRMLVEEWNETAAEYPADSCIHELFEAQVRRTPEATALVHARETLSYGELNARANRLAHHLVRLGVKPGDRVALCVERSPEMVAGVLAVLKAGAAFVPLDPAYPAERLRFMLEDSAPVVLLTRPELAGLFAGVPVVDVDAGAGEAETDLPRRAAGPEAVAYLTYTSGSTGRPKGVSAVHHRALNLIHWYGRELGIGADDAVLIVSSYSFDGTYRNLFAPLFAGGRVHLAAEPFDPHAILEQIQAGGITMMNLTPTAFGALVEASRGAELGGMRRIVLVGEPAQARTLLQLPEPRPELVNLYGPTECSGITTYHRLATDLTRYLDRPVPAGRPIANGRVYVLDGHGQPVPTGVAGEIHIGGVPVGPGYHARPELTAERYVADPFSTEPGARMYRTGDVGRWLADGTLEVLGRNDSQVKIRGFRIEPGEVEACLLELPEVREAAVVAREDAPGEKRLVAYVAAPELDVEALRKHLAAKLPEYMVPAAYVRLESLPVSPNGKLDRRALPAPDQEAYTARAYVPPAGEVEEAVAAIWAEVLGVERVGREDHFFELGGHSLLAVQVVSRVRRALGTEVALAHLFTHPVLAEFARVLEQSERSDLPAIVPVEHGGRAALSFAQQRLWFLEQLGGAGAAYHIPMSVRLRGALDRDALRRALDGVAARHEALRTTFAQVDGEPVQVIAPESRFQLAEQELGGAELASVMAEEAAAPFDLERGPLVRGRLVRIASDDHVLLVTMHHIVSDGWSMGVLVEELTALYTAFERGDGDPLPALPVQYADYAAWQRKWVDGDVLSQQAEYWKAALAGAPELLELPADRPRPAVQDHAGAFAGIELDEELTASLKALGQRHGTTLFMTLMAAWAAVLARLTGQDDVVIGTPTANRGRAEIEGLIGFFVNTLALRVDLAGEPTVAELLGRVKARALEAQAHQDIPFERVVEAVQPVRSTAHSPLFQVVFAWQSAPGGALRLPGLEIGSTGAGSRVSAKFDLSLALQESDGRIVGGVEYATALFDDPTVKRYLGYLRRVLEAMVADERQAVSRLPLLGDDERRRLVEEWNATDAEFPAATGVHALFEAQARRTPDAIALVDGDVSLTYAELDARANHLAHHLLTLGVQAGERVAILIPRALELVVAELAVLRAGAAYVPIDPTFPAERIRFMVADSGARLVLARSGDVLPELAAERIDVDAAPEAPAGTLPEAAGGNAAAYVMYTSGSTGEPKGVVVPHRAIVRLVINNGYAEFGAEDRVAFAANPAFDASTMEVWAPLLNGGRIVIIPQDVLLEPARFAAALREQGVDVLWMTVGLFNRYVDALQDVLPGLRYLIVGGDALDPRVIARVVEQHKPRHLLNGYGPTETTTFAITHDITEVPEGVRGIPLGRPISNTRIYLLDNHLQPVPTGAAGEVYIGGAGVALGYLNQPALTEERFVEDVFGGGRMYRTGDVARWLPDGTVEFLGRNDGQVKVRGFRIELGEIEARLAEHAQIREAVVIVREDEPGEKRLVAYCAGSGGVDAEALRAHLAAKLPEYMVPAAYVWLETLPLTSNGKVDRRALPAPHADAFATREYEAPAGETEEVLAGIWSEVLGVERVGRRDHFFALGGHSLLAVQLISRVRQALGVEVALGELFARPTLADFAAGLATAARAELPPIVPVDANERTALSFAQQRLWLLEQLGAAGRAYHIPVALRLRGELDAEALERALDHIVQRHEALRTVFRTANGEAVQHVDPASRFPLVREELGGRPLHAVMAEEAGAPFSLQHGPLIRGRLVRMASDDHALLITMHHIVSDGWSMGVLVDELSALYGAFTRGEPDPLPALPVQYADYAAWQRKWVDGEVLQQQAEYWKSALAGAPALLELPADRPRPARQDHSGAFAALELDEELTASLKALGQKHGTTLYMTLMAAWAAVLGRLSGHDDLVIGTPTANRGRAEIEGLVGFFVNTLALRVDLAGEPTAAELLARVRTRALEAQANQDIPFEQVVERVQPARSMAHSPLFQVMLAWQSAPRGNLALPGLALSPLAAESGTTAKFDLSLDLHEAGGRIAGGLTYATALFDAATAERYLGYLRRTLEWMVAADDQPLNHVPLLSPEERRRVVEEWNATDVAYPTGLCVHELFEAQAARTPHAVAVARGDRSLTYAELDERANRLAHHLRDQGVGPDARVAICVERGVEMVVGLLAILKAGGAYVPLDPAYPEERLRYMVEDSAPVAVLHDGSRFPELRVPAIDVREPAAWAHHPATAPERGGLRADHLAYLIYTSGSTGRPKGVMVEHRNAANFLNWGRDTFGGVLGRTLFSTSLNFDLAVFECFVPLVSGGTVQVMRDALELAGAAGTLVNTVPSAMKALVETGRVPRGVHTVNLAGEPLKRALVEEIFATTGVERVCNLYGPSETTTYSTWVEMTRGGGFAPHVGRPVANTRVYITDPRSEPVPVGVAGEILIGGAGVARGYLNRPELTAERFVEDPFHGGRMYRTGDLGRWLPDGTIEFLGRNDGQVKVRGHRIEPGEIEARLEEHAEVREAVVMAREDVPGDTRLVAYHVGTAGADELRAHLAARIPAYMVPAAYVRLDAMPLTPNGKTDRRALPAPDGEAFGARGYEAPQGDAETALAEIWRELLGVERVGRHDNFFQLGGHSLLAVKLLDRMREAGLHADVEALFTDATLASLAARAGEAPDDVEIPSNLIPKPADPAGDPESSELFI